MRKLKTKILAKALALITITTTLAVSFSNTNIVGKTKDIDVFVNEKQVQFGEDLGYPVIENGRTMVPLRVVSENIGYKVDWSAKERKAIVQNNGTKVELEVGSYYALVNGKKTPIDRRDNGEVIDTKSYIKGGRTYVPLRFVSEALGARVGYESTKTKHTINIYTDAKPVDSKNGYVGGVVNTVGQKGYIDLETDGKSMGKGWVEPKFTAGLHDKTPNEPIRIFVDNPEAFDDSVRFDSKIIGKYEHYNTGTMDDWFDGGRFKYNSVLKDTNKAGDIFSFVIPKSFNAVDAKGKPLNIDTVKGQTIEIEIVAKYKGMSKRYVIPAKL